ncbi:phage Gp37/Gp68 family protein [Candidatus Pacearchaeota archaeon]|nr:phage Gp37/Gp68 family protein [Candidatus Pacearchaeota archaeon]
MAKNTEISWCDSTFNPWWGCRKIAPGCDNCYAEKFANRFGSFWGSNSSFRILSDKYWNDPLRWNRDASLENKRRKVFCGSMCDWADSNGPEDQRERLWELIRKTPMLDWLLLTKRANNIIKYLPEDWGNGYDNVWLGVSVENKKHGLPRIDILRKIPAKIRFISAEPLLENLNSIDLYGVGFLIIGGESGPGARPMHPDWARSIRDQCQKSGTAFFFKQMSGKTKAERKNIPHDLQIREFQNAN